MQNAHPRLRPGSTSYWLRKRVPDKYRPIVGRKEVWRSLNETDLRRATALCASMSVELEDGWEAMLKAMGPSSLPPAETLTHEEIWALAGEFFLEYTEKNRTEPGTVWDREAALKLHERKARRLFPVPHWKSFVYRQEIADFLRSKGRWLDEDSMRRFAVAYYERRGDAEKDLLEKAKGNYGKSEVAAQITIVRKKIPAIDAFERYAAACSLKPRTKKRWRPVFDHLIKFLTHDDLSRVKKTDIVAWKNVLLAETGPKGRVLRVPRTVRDVWLPP